MNIELTIYHAGKTQLPPVLDGITWTTERRGSPGKLEFTVVKDADADFTEGDLVTLTVDGKGVFYGYVFVKKRDKRQHISVTAYDQLRYLKNKDTYIYEDKTASDVIRMIAGDFDLKVGTIAQTSYNITSRVEDNATLMDIINNALDLENTNVGNMYVLYDDFGALALKPLSDMSVDIVIDETGAENFDYSSSIDDQTYNRVKLSRENEETGKRDIYVVEDSSHINDWGILQYFDTLSEGENGDQKASALLSMYNQKTRKLRISKAFGDIRVRAGSLIVVALALGDINLQNWMLVNKCTHTFAGDLHQMDLDLMGGGIDG